MNNHSQVAIVLSGLVVVSVIGCGPSLDDVIERFRPEVAPRLAAVEKIAKSIATCGATGKIAVDGANVRIATSLDLNERPEVAARANAALTWDSALEDLTHVPQTIYDQLGCVVNRCAALLRNKRHADYDFMRGSRGGAPPQPERAAEELGMCARLRYLVVVHVVDSQPPVANGNKTFIGGAMRGEALVFDLTDGAYLGGVGFGAESSASVAVYTRTSSKSDGSDYHVERDSLDERVSSDFRNNVQTSLRQALGAHGISF